MNQNKSGKLLRWFKPLGWVIGIVLSIILPQIAAPFAPTLPFRLGGAFSAIAGFTVMYVLLQGSTKFIKMSSTFVALILGLGCAAWYRSLLLSEENTTPNALTEWFQFVLFCLSHLGLFAILASAYRHGGAFILERLGKISVPES